MHKKNGIQFKDFNPLGEVFSLTMMTGQVLTSVSPVSTLITVKTPFKIDVKKNKANDKVNQLND